MCDLCLKPCQKGYPCVYLTYAGSHKATCAYSACKMFETEGFIVDSLTGEKMEFVCKPIVDEKADEALASRADIEHTRELEKIMKSGNTYKRRRGAIRQKRVATN